MKFTLILEVLNFLSSWDARDEEADLCFQICLPPRCFGSHLCPWHASLSLEYFSFAPGRKLRGDHASPFFLYRFLFLLALLIEILELTNIQELSGNQSVLGTGSSTFALALEKINPIIWIQISELEDRQEVPPRGICWRSSALLWSFQVFRKDLCQDNTTSWIVRDTTKQQLQMVRSLKTYFHIEQLKRKNQICLKCHSWSLYLLRLIKVSWIFVEFLWNFPGMLDFPQALLHTAPSICWKSC